jgi:DNA polymerase III subunit gamma/tau
LIADEKTIPDKSFQIKDISLPEAGLVKSEFSSDAFMETWKEFTESLTGEGKRIVSMFKSIVPEVDNGSSIRIHLSNAAQKDLFIQNYKQKLISYLESRFNISEIDIESIVDVTETNELLYSDDQKYSYLAAKYPIIKDLKKTFNLDIE